MAAVVRDLCADSASSYTPSHPAFAVVFMAHFGYRPTPAGLADFRRRRLVGIANHVATSVNTRFYVCWFGGDCYVDILRVLAT